MPFTPFHFGPGFLFKSVGRFKFSFFIFFISQVLIDLEVIFNLWVDNSSLHTYFHTYVGSLVVVAIIMMVDFFAFSSNKIQKILSTHCKFDRTKLSTRTVFVSAILGSFSHIFLDSIMHKDMTPLWPFTPSNPHLHLTNPLNLHLTCIRRSNYLDWQ